MIFGKFQLSNNAIHTHNDSYVLTNITTISARRPFLGASIMLSALMVIFTLSFIDLLFMHELGIFLFSILATLFLGLWLGQLQLLSGDLRGSELGTAVWGSYAHLNRIRREIAEAVSQLNSSEQSNTKLMKGERL